MHTHNTLTATECINPLKPTVAIIAFRHNTATGDVAYQAAYNIRSVIATALQRSHSRDAHCPILPFLAEFLARDSI